MYRERYVRTVGSTTGVIGRLHSLPALERDGYGGISRLPVSLRILLESRLRHADSTPACEAQLRQLAGWRSQARFEARLPSALRANYLMSPALVVAYALAGRIDIDLPREPIGQAASGKPVYLHESWPSPADTALALQLGHPNGQQHSCTLRLCIDTESEAAYYRHGGTMPYLVRTLLSNASLAPQQVPA